MKLRKALAPRPGGLRVMIHFYSLGFDTEVIGRPPKVSVPVERVDDAHVFSEDELVEILARSD